MPISITTRSKEVLEAIIDVWDENDALLPGNISYGAVFAMCDELGIPHPPRIRQLCDEIAAGRFSARAEN